MAVTEPVEGLDMLVSGFALILEAIREEQQQTADIVTANKKETEKIWRALVSMAGAVMAMQREMEKMREHGHEVRIVKEAGRS